MTPVVATGTHRTAQSGAMSRVLTGLLVAAAALQLSSCACTLAGCDDGLQVTVTPSGGSFAPGAYVLTVTVSAEEYGQPLEPATCEIAFTYDGTLCDGQSCSFDDSACNLEVYLLDQQLELEIRSSAPMTAELSISRDNVALANELLDPPYEKLAPNGESCGPVCYRSAMQLMID